MGKFHLDDIWKGDGGGLLIDSQNGLLLVLAGSDHLLHHGHGWGVMVVVGADPTPTPSMDLGHQGHNHVAPQVQVLDLSNESRLGYQVTSF